MTKKQIVIIININNKFGHQLSTVCTRFQNVKLSVLFLSVCVQFLRFPLFFGWTDASSRKMHVRNPSDKHKLRAETSRFKTEWQKQEKNPIRFHTKIDYERAKKKRISFHFFFIIVVFVAVVVQSHWQRNVSQFLFMHKCDENMELYRNMWVTPFASLSLSLSRSLWLALCHSIFFQVPFSSLPSFVSAKNFRMQNMKRKTVFSRFFLILLSIFDLFFLCESMQLLFF